MQPKEQGTLTLLLSNFDQGNRDQFTTNWNKYVPAQFRDNDTKKLEFYLQIYFLIYSIHPNTPKAGRR